MTIESHTADNDTTPTEEVRLGTTDRYSVDRMLASNSGATLYDVTSANIRRPMVLLETTSTLASFHTENVDPGIDETSAIAIAPRDTGTHNHIEFVVFDLEDDDEALCGGAYYGWDPFRVELLAKIVSTLCTARDKGLRLPLCDWETLVVSTSRSVRFMSPVAQAQADGDTPVALLLEREYMEALRNIVPKLVRGNFMPLPTIENDLVPHAPDNGNPAIWSSHLRTSLEMRQTLDDLVSGRLESLDAVRDAIDLFGPFRVVRKRTGWGTHRGLVRESNEDGLMMMEQTVATAGRPLRMELYAVADGMGGHEAGEIASEITLKSMAVEIVGGLNLTSARELGRDVLDHEFLAERMVAAIEQTNLKLRQYSWDTHSSSTRKPGSTLVCALALGPMVTIGHVGDSRAYKIRLDGKLERVTRDHSPVQKLVDLNEITDDEAFYHPQRNQISSNIGIKPELLLRDVQVRFMREGEGLILCSDGLTDMLRDAEIEALCRDEDDPRRLSQRLVESACERGGHDNITVIVITRASGPAQEERESPPNVS